MCKIICICLALFLCLSAQNEARQLTVADFIKVVGPLYQYVGKDSTEIMKEVITKIYQNPEMREFTLREAKNLGFSHLYNHTMDTTEFPCLNFSIPKEHGSNIDRLTPADINVVAALGDSLTAGLGIEATSVFGLLTENKGKVFDIGGIPNTMTLINFIRKYNPNVKGYSMKNTKINSDTDALNMAVSGATARDLMEQADKLIKTMKSDPSIDFNNDWKMVNILIGNNDICRSCEFWHYGQFTTAKFVKRLTAVLDKLKAEMPRTFVSIITMLDVYEIKRLNIGVVCSLMHIYECPCVAYSMNIKKVMQHTTDIQNSMFKIVANGRYDDKPDFTVIVQPFFQETFIPMKSGTPDLSYFAPDCFHLSEKGHGQVALSLWNSFFDKVGAKRKSWHTGEKFDCPTAKNPYFATRRNSKL